MLTSASPNRKPGFLTKLAYGFGAAADGTKNNGFEYFLLIFYSQVLGVDALLVGSALLLALFVDAVSDPVVGYWSDNLRTRMGRRHPFMYAVAIPTAFAYYFVWNPPAGLTGNDLFPFLLAMTIIVRILFTFYEVPSSAMVAELSESYDERSSFLSYRYFFAWVGGVTVAIIALRYLLVANERYASGWLNVEGYGQYGLIAAMIIFASMAVSALGTHHYIPHLKSPPQRRGLTIKMIFGEIFETLSNKSFLALFVAALCGFMANGVSASLNYYINGYFWEFTTEQTSVLTISVYFSALMALVIAPMATRILGKKKGAIIVGFIAFTVAPLLPMLRLLGFMPPNGSDLLFNIVLFVTIFDVALIITAQILMASMIADVVEQSELKTGRRSEGIFFAGISFIRKMARGSGIMIATVVLSIAEITRQMNPGDIAPESIWKLGAYYAFGIFSLWMLMILFLFFYRINREDHEANLQALKQRAAETALEMPK